MAYLGLISSCPFVANYDITLARCMQEGDAVTKSHGSAPESQKGGRRHLAAAAEQGAAFLDDSQALGGMHRTEL